MKAFILRAPTGKPLKRVASPSPAVTRLKPGANERGAI